LDALDLGRRDHQPLAQRRSRGHEDAGSLALGGRLLLLRLGVRAAPRASGEREQQGKPSCEVATHDNLTNLPFELSPNRRFASNFLLDRNGGESPRRRGAIQTPWSFGVLAPWRFKSIRVKPALERASLELTEPGRARSRRCEERGASLSVD